MSLFYKELLRCPILVQTLSHKTSAFLLRIEHEERYLHKRGFENKEDTEMFATLELKDAPMTQEIHGARNKMRKGT